MWCKDLTSIATCWCEKERMIGAKPPVGSLFAGRVKPELLFVNIHLVFWSPENRFCTRFGNLGRCSGHTRSLFISSNVTYGEMCPPQSSEAARRRAIVAARPWKQATPGGVLLAQTCTGLCPTRLSLEVRFGLVF